ncbi:hypothetical protein BV20DRAFT_651114 [Pilatotrama ljubarskyi]|nr:hypothetical protein BV20DRAFT_651114 [Pilatotrama ljubarskyi]
MLAVPPVRKLISQPPHGLNRSYVGYMRDEDRPDFEGAKYIIKKLVPQELDLHRSWGRQDETAKKQLIEKVLEAYPAFADYESAWPVLYYSCQTLHHVRRPIDKPHRQRRLAAPAKAGANRCHEAASTGKKTQDPGRCRRRGHARATQLDTDGAVSLAAHAGLANVLHQTAGLQEVFRFLVALEGTLGYLLDRFQFTGITSKARLMALARWTISDRDAFLRNELQLSAFERKVVSGALNELLHEA